MAQICSSRRAELQPVIDRLGRLPELLEALVAPLSLAQLTTPFLAHEWTVAQNVHHLADSHMNSFIRLKLILTEAYPTLKPYDQDQWAARADANHAAIQLSLQLLRGLHARWVLLFESLADDEWNRAGYHPENGEVTVADLLHSYADHGEGHLDQIRRTLAAAT